MNGEMTLQGKELLSSYYKITESAGYNIKKLPTNNFTDSLLEEKLENLTDEEIELLNSVTF